MNFAVLLHVRDHSKTVGSARHLLLEIATHINYHSGVTRLSVERLAHRLHVGARHVRKLLAVLEASGELVIWRTAGRHANTYQVATHGCAACDARANPALRARVDFSLETEHEFPSRTSWAHAVKRRDEYRCQECGSLEDIHAHHIVPRSQGGQDILSNGQTLCPTCHGIAHRTPTDVNRGWEGRVHSRNPGSQDRQPGLRGPAIKKSSKEDKLKDAGIAAREPLEAKAVCGWHHPDVRCAVCR
jgi:5-methylcytosine-specific restriction endonuclease McrA